MESRISDLSDSASAIVSVESRVPSIVRYHTCKVRTPTPRHDDGETRIEVHTSVVADAGFVLRVAFVLQILTSRPENGLQFRPHSLISSSLNK
jgi:hypothetical protein